jgi:diacylglycerol kinase family enzyme
VRIVFVANSRSGAGDRVEDAERLLRGSGAEVERLGLEAFCDGPESVDEERLAAEAERLRGAVDRIVVAGGDGSIGPAALLALRTELPLAVLPVGTANSFARFLDLPLDLEDAAELAASTDPELRDAEVAEAAGRPFVNVAACGLSVLAADRARPLKRRLGVLAYAVGAARAGATGRRSAARWSATARRPGAARAGRSWSPPRARSAATARPAASTRPTASSTWRSSRPARASRWSSARSPCAAASSSTTTRSPTSAAGSSS